MVLLIAEERTETVTLNENMTMSVPVIGVTCTSDVGHVKKAVRSVSGVASATVNLATERASIRSDDIGISVESLELVAKNAGYTPRLIETGNTARDLQVQSNESDTVSQRRSLFLAAFLTLLPEEVVA